MVGARGAPGRVTNVVRAGKAGGRADEAAPEMVVKGEAAP